MGFNLYFAGSQHSSLDEYMQQLNCNRLFTFAVKPNKVFYSYYEHPQCKVFMDSGAFSVHHNGAKIDIDKYIEFINKHKSEKVLWAELDTIPHPILNAQTTKISAEESWQKYLYMMDRVDDDIKDRVIPLYHLGEPYEAFEKILNTEVHGKLVPYMGIGGNVGADRKTLDNLYTHLFQIVKKSKNPNIKIHAFGMTMLELLEKYPFYSADSTSWLMAGTKGRIKTKCKGLILVSDRQTKNPLHINNLSTDIQNLVKKELKEEMDYTVEDVATDYKKRLKFNIHYYKQWADNYKYKGPDSNVIRKRWF